MSALPENKDNFFSLLGVDKREDSFTTLISMIFEHGKLNIKKTICDFFECGEINYDKADLKIRKSVETKPDLFRCNKGLIEKVKKQTNTPDLLLQAENIIVIIEVKVLSKEGINQLKRYSETANYLTRKDKPQDLQKFYLTLDGQVSRNSYGFKSKKWSDLVSAIVFNESGIENSRLKILINDLNKLLNDYEYNLKLVSRSIDEASFKEIMDRFDKIGHPFFTYEKLLAMYFNWLSEKNEFIVESLFSNGEQVIIYKDPWQCENSLEHILDGKDIKDGTSYYESFSREEDPKGFRILIKIKLGSKRSNFKILVNFESYPYLSEENIVSTYGKQVLDYINNQRKLFVYYVLAQKEIFGKDIEIVEDKKNLVVKTTVAVDLSRIEVQMKINEIIGIYEELIDGYFNTLKNKRMNISDYL